MTSPTPADNGTSFDMAVFYGAEHGQGGARAGGTETGRVERDPSLGFARIARDYGYTLAELRKL